MTVGGILVSRSASAGLVQPGVHLLALLRYAAIHPLSLGALLYTPNLTSPDQGYEYKDAVVHVTG